MSKAVFGIYLYSTKKGVYCYNPSTIGYLDLDIIKEIGAESNRLMLQPPDQESEDASPVTYKIIATHSCCVNNVPYIAYAAIPESLDPISSQFVQPLFNAGEALAGYVDKIASDIIKLEEEWTTEVNKLSKNEMDSIISDNNELRAVIDKLNIYKNEYYEPACDCLNPFVTYKKFIERFFNECNFYDIIPLQEKRIQLFRKSQKTWKRK